MHTAEEDLMAICVARAPVNKLTTQQASLTTGTEQAKVKPAPLACCSRELKVAATIYHRELGLVGQSMLSLKGLVAPGKDNENTAEVQARGIADKTSKQRKLVIGGTGCLGQLVVSVSALYSSLM